MDLAAYWNAVAAKQPDALRRFLHPKAIVRWHNTNEQFTAAEFIRANCEYPGEWAGELQRVEQAGDVTIAIVRVYARDSSFSCHVTSFMKIEGEKILSLDEYWGDDGPAPAWRQDKHLGRPIR